MVDQVIHANNTYSAHLIGLASSSLGITRVSAGFDTIVLQDDDDGTYIQIAANSGDAPGKVIVDFQSDLLMPDGMVADSVQLFLRMVNVGAGPSVAGIGFLDREDDYSPWPAGGVVAAPDTLGWVEVTPTEGDWLASAYDVFGGRLSLLIDAGWSGTEPASYGWRLTEAYFLVGLIPADVPTPTAGLFRPPSLRMLQRGGRGGIGGIPRAVGNPTRQASPRRGSGTVL